jgi:hypothetical protein
MKIRESPMSLQKAKRIFPLKKGIEGIKKAES